MDRVRRQTQTPTGTSAESSSGTPDPSDQSAKSTSSATAGTAVSVCPPLTNPPVLAENSQSCVTAVCNILETTTTWENVSVPCPESLTIVNDTTSLVTDVPGSVAPSSTSSSIEALTSSEASPSSDTRAPSIGTSAATHSVNRGISGGAVAGVAIGTLLAGALIAGAVFFFLLRRQRGKQSVTAAAYQAPHPPYNDALAVSEKGPTAVAGAFATSIDDMLPQPEADDSIIDAALKIRDNIKNHVRTYYHSAPVPISGINQAGLQGLATVTGVSSSVLASMISNPSNRQDTLRLLVGWIILSSCTGEGEHSLLPAELSRLASSIPGRSGASSGHSAMYSKWKTITGALLQQQYGQNVQGPARDQLLAKTSTDLNAMLAPFVQGGMAGGQRGKNLDMILTRSANFAFLLFAQPGIFQFDFVGQHGGLVVFPALVQSVGDQGQVLRPARVLLEKEIAA